MNPRLAEAKKVEAMEAIPKRLDLIEAKLDELIALVKAAAPRPETAQRLPSQQPARR